VSVTVRDFFEAGEQPLAIETEAGEQHFNRGIHEIALHRPGLALAGFFQHFPQRRMQVFGLSEQAYIKNLSSRERGNRLEQLCEKHIPCIVVTRNRHVPR